MISFLTFWTPECYKFFRFCFAVVHNSLDSNHQSSTSPPSATVPKASAKVLVPVKVKQAEHDAASEKSNSSSPGDVLGLGNYASDNEDGDDEMDSSSMPTPLKDAAHQSSIKKTSDGMPDVSNNGSSQIKLEENGRSQTNLMSNLGNTSSSLSKTSNGAAIGQLHDDKVTKKLDHSHPSKVVSEDGDNELNAFERRHDRSNGKTAGVEKTTEDLQISDSRIRTEKVDRHDRNSSEDFTKDVQNSKTKGDEKSNENHRRKDERHQKKEKADDSNETKERAKDHNVRHGEKAKESESRKRSSHVDVKGENKEPEKARRGSTVEDTNRRKEHTRDKGEHKSRHKDASKSDRHRRKRSSSVSSRGRSGRDHAVNHNSESSEGSDGSKRFRTHVHLTFFIWLSYTVHHNIFFTAGSCTQENVTYHHLQSGLEEGIAYKDICYFIFRFAILCFRCFGACSLQIYS